MSASRASALPEDIREEFPFASHTFGRPGGTMHFLDEGHGPVVLMLHGNPTWSFYFRNLVRFLSARGYRCIVPDHIGCGLSDKPQSYAYTLRQRIEDVAALVDHLGIKQFSLVAHDWGGAIGCGLAAQRPEALQKLVLLNTGAFLSKRIPLRIAAIKIPFLGEWIIRGLNGFAGPAATMAAQVPLKAAVKRGLLWPYRSWSDRVAVWNFVKDIPLHKGHRSYGDLQAVETGLESLADKPVQLIWGAKDFCFTLHFHDRFQQFFPNARSKIYRECGHYILEDGGDAVCQDILNFLEAADSENIT
jgi:haloalkane dehalogenase